MAADGIARGAPSTVTPRDYNVAVDLIERNLKSRRGQKIAYIDDCGRYSDAELAERVDRAANALLGLGIEPGRVPLSTSRTRAAPCAGYGGRTTRLPQLSVRTATGHQAQIRKGS